VVARQQAEQKKLREANPALNNPFTAHAAVMNVDGLIVSNSYSFNDYTSIYLF
jgi:hypothetical protein